MFFNFIYYMSRKNVLFNHLLRWLYACDIPINVTIGENGHIGHKGLGVVIHPKAKIGNNVWIEHHVCLGQKTAESEAPIIEDDCVIGAYAIILGNVTVSKRSVIGAGSIVTHDIPANSIYYNKRIEIIKSNYKKLDNIK